MKKIFLSLSVITLSIFLTGCFSVDGNFKTIRNITLKEYGRNFVTEHEFALGSFELWVAGGIVGLVESDEIATEVLNSVSEVQIGVYTRTDDEKYPAKNLLKKIDNEMSQKGWKYIVRSYSDGEMSAVYINKDSDKMLKELFVINIDGREMNIVQVSGNLEKLIETAIKENGIHWNKEKHHRLAER